jgi:hypothetical protein
MTDIDIQGSIIANKRVDIIKEGGEYVTLNFNTKKLGKKKTTKLIKDSIKIFDSGAVKIFAIYLKSRKIE